MLPTAAVQHYNSQRQIAAEAIQATRTRWRQVGDDFDAGWRDVGGELVAGVQGSMADAAQGGVEYVPAVLAETGQSAAGMIPAAPAAFAVANRDGMPVERVLHTSVIRAKQAVAAGASVYGALLEARKFLDVAVPSLIADANRGAVQATIASTPVTGYVRMLNPPSCRRCIPLAGKWFRWNKGFQRHPGCDCRHIPMAENRAGDFTTDPYEMFNEMTEDEQARIFGKANAQAIRDGGDIWQITNADARERHRLYKGRGRPTLDEIYTEAGGSKGRAVELMREHGYITGPQQLRQRAERFAAPISQPVRAGSARERVLAARDSGVRDPLDRATMTADEQRLFDAVYRREYARVNGYVPRSIGLNSADEISGARGIPLTPSRWDQLDEAVQRQIGRIDLTRPEGGDLLKLTDALGLNDGRADIIHERIYSQMVDRFQTSTRRRGFGLAEALRSL
jgi:hypothetical protein